MFDAALIAAIRGGGSPTGHVVQVDYFRDLYAGHYEAHTTVAETFTGSILGLGAAAELDGEISSLDGVTWQIRADGVPIEASGDLGMPFAIAAFGGESFTQDLQPGDGFAEITACIDDALRLSHLHGVAAVRIDGEFTDVLLRSEPRQEPPFTPLPEVLDHEVRFAFPTWSGTLMGFRFPDVDDGEVVPGLHLHAIAADRASGGHCHEARVRQATVTIWFDDLRIEVPDHPHADQPLT